MAERAIIKFKATYGGETIYVEDVKNVEILPNIEVIRIHNKENDVLLLPDPQAILFIRTEETNKF